MQTNDRKQFIDWAAQNKWFCFNQYVGKGEYEILSYVTPYGLQVSVKIINGKVDKVTPWDGSQSGVI